MPLEPRLANQENHRERPLILITNDDGVYAPGIRAVAESLRELGDIIVVAPDHQMSAASHSISLYKPLRIKKVSEDIYAIDGTPTDCINLGVNEILKEMPDLVVSGINSGPNMGDDINYSGTVSAALEGAIFGIPAIAVSIAVSIVANEEIDYSLAARFTGMLSKKVLTEGLPENTMLNVNVPCSEGVRITDYKFTVQGKKIYSDIIDEKLDPRGRKYYWIAGEESGYEKIENSDCQTVYGENRISITPIIVNLTNLRAYEDIKDWKL